MDDGRWIDCTVVGFKIWHRLDKVLADGGKVFEGRLSEERQAELVRNMYLAPSWRADFAKLLLRRSL